MPTTLSNPKMSAALTARLQASVRGMRRGQGGQRLAPTRMAILRSSVVVMLALVAFVVWQELQSRAQQLADAKSQLTRERSELRATLTPNAYTLSERVLLALRRESNDYTGAFKEDTLSQGNDWDALLRRPIIYARLPTASANQPEKLESGLSESKPDAFVLCLKEPAEDQSEKALMKRINAINGDAAATKEQLVNIHPAFDAVVSLQLLDSAFDNRVAAAEELKPVLELQKMWDDARVDERVPAVFAEVLIAVLDEPKLADTPVELDGASVHGVRVVIVDLSRDLEKVLFRGRYEMNPSWVSERRRHQYAQALDSCRVAAQVRQVTAAAQSYDAARSK